MKAIVCAAVALFCGSVFAEPVLQRVLGTVSVNSRVAKVGDVVPPGASVQTGSNSRAEVLFDDGHLVALGAGSQFQLRQYVYSKENPSKDNVVLNLLVGTFRSITGALGARNPARFSLTTPTATVGIRGTDFTAHVGDPGTVTSWTGGERIQVASLGGLSDVVESEASVEIAQIPIHPTFFQVTSGSIGVSTGVGSALVGAGQAIGIGAGGAISFVGVGALPGAMQLMINTPLAAGAGIGGVSAGSGASGAGGVGAGASGATGAAVGTFATGTGVAAGVVAVGVVASTLSSGTGTTGTR